MSIPAIGILGLGFLGKTLAEQHSWPEESWGSWFHPPEPDLDLKRFQFLGARTSRPLFQLNWENREHWPRIPEHEVVLVLCIPPVFQDPRQELGRLQTWTAWMNQHRPALKRMIYLSTTGVYPKQEGLWTEDSPVNPDSESGIVRLQSELELARGFRLQVIRPGGIYGPNRDLIARLRAGKSIPDSGMPTHRIHVRDLAEIICYCVEHPEVRCLNAVDDDPTPSPRVARWLLDEFPGLAGELPKKSRTFDSAVKTRRIISNLKLKELGISLKYPTYREGMAL